MKSKLMILLIITCFSCSKEKHYCDEIIEKPPLSGDIKTDLDTIYYESVLNGKNFVVDCNSSVVWIADDFKLTSEGEVIESYNFKIK